MAVLALVLTAVVWPQLQGAVAPAAPPTGLSGASGGSAMALLAAGLWPGWFWLHHHGHLFARYRAANAAGVDLARFVLAAVWSGRGSGGPDHDSLSRPLGSPPPVDGLLRAASGRHHAGRVVAQLAGLCAGQPAGWFAVHRHHPVCNARGAPRASARCVGVHRFAHGHLRPGPDCRAALGGAAAWGAAPAQRRALRCL